mgnify:CR=1 FL=1
MKKCKLILRVNGEELEFNLITKEGCIEPIALVSNMPCDEKNNQKMHEEVKFINLLGTNFNGVGAREARTKMEVNLINLPFQKGIGEKLRRLEKGKQILLQSEVEPLYDKSNTPPWHLRKLDDGDTCTARHTVEWLGSFDPWGENDSPKT